MADVECFTAQCSCSAQRHEQVQAALRLARVGCQCNRAKQKCPANFQTARGGVVRADGKVVPGKERRRANFLEGTKRRDPQEGKDLTAKSFSPRACCEDEGWGLLLLLYTCGRRGGGRVSTFQYGGWERCKGAILPIMVANSPPCCRSLS
jgi:hypothetical protein